MCFEGMRTHICKGSQTCQSSNSANNNIPDYLPDQAKEDVKSFHLTVSSDIYRAIGDLARMHTMTFNDFVIQALSERMGQELMKDPMLFLRYIPSYWSAVL